MFETRRSNRLIRIVLSAALLLALQVAAPATAASPAAATGAGALDRWISAPGVADVAFDDSRRLLYISAGNQVLRYAIDTNTFLTPWTINGSSLKGMDISPDGKTLAVADLNCGSYYNWIRIIDLETGSIRKGQFLLNGGEGGTWSVAFGADGQCLVTSVYQGSGRVPMRRYDPATGVTTTIATVCMKTMLCASADRSVIGWAEANLSTGPVGRYIVSNGTIARVDGYDTSTSGYNYEIATNANGTRFFVPTYNKNWLFDGAPARLKSWVRQTNGAVYHPTRNILFVAETDSSEIRAYEMDSVTPLGQKSIGRTFGWIGNWGFGEGRLKTSADGRLLFATVDQGVWMGSTSFLSLADEFPGRSLPASSFEATWSAPATPRTVHSFEMTAGSSFDATLDVGDGVDVDLALYPPTKHDHLDSVSEVASSAAEGVGVDESLHYVAPVTATYYLMSTLATGSGETTLTYTITPGAVPADDDDIPGVALPAAVDDTLDATGDTWDVYRVNLARRASVAITVTPDAGLDADVVVFSGSGKHVAFFEPDRVVAGGGLGAAESTVLTAPATADYYLAIRGSTGAGGYHLESQTLPPPALATSVSVESSSSGAWAIVSGAVQDEEGAAVPNGSLYLESSADGVTWDVVGTPSTDQAGSFSATVALPKTTWFRARYVGLADTYIGSVSDAIKTVRAPGITWNTSPPAMVSAGQKFVVRTTVDVPHAEGTCTATYRYERLENGIWVERQSMEVTGGVGPNDLREFVLSAAVPTAGSWRVALDVEADDAHGARISDYKQFEVGVATLSISASKSTVAVGSAVTLTGYLKSAQSGFPLVGKSVKLQASTDGNSWTDVKTMTTVTGGKVVATVNPRYRRYYRFAFAGDSKWQAKNSSSKVLTTIFTLSGTTAGHFTTKKVYLTQGNRKIRITIYAPGQRVYIHQQDESQKLLLANAPGMTEGTLEVVEPGYVHFQVVGNGYYKIQVWN